MQNWLEIYMLNEMLLLFSIVIAFLVLTIFGKRRTWMTTDSFMTVTCGVAFFFFPKQLLKAEADGEIRTMDENVATIFGITLLCSGLSWLMHEKSKDEKVVETFLVSRIFTSGALLAMLSFAYFLNKPDNKPASKDKKSIDWSEQVQYMGVIPLLLWFLGHVLQLFLSNVATCLPPQATKTNSYLRIQAIIMFLIGISLIAFPGKVIGMAFKQSGDKVMLHFVRCIGSVFIGNSITALHSPTFSCEKDKRNVLLSQLCVSSLQLLYACLLAYRGTIELNFLYGCAFVHLPLYLNTLGGYIFSIKQNVPECDKSE